MKNVFIHPDQSKEERLISSNMRALVDAINKGNRKLIVRGSRVNKQLNEPEDSGKIGHIVVRTTQTTEMIIIDSIKGVIRNLIFAWQSRLIKHRVNVMVHMLTLAIQLIETTEMTLRTDNSCGVIHIKNLVTLAADEIVIEEVITIVLVDRFEQVFGTLMGGV